MALEELHLKSGSWLAVNCGSMPSDKNCQVLIMAPEDQRDDLLDAAAEHAAAKHGHTNNEELHAGINSMLQAIEV
ncbi:MAG: DUF1059 domain-containing protein [Patescibacteria group bacterium]|nr:DUF1059 domain-containing protein [Patescibacteria group bacterium]